MSKKILSIALAVVMLFSVMACTVGAANTTVTTTFPGAGQIGFRVVSDAYVGMPAGEEVAVKVYWVHPADVDYDSWLQSLGNIVLCYNNEAYTYNTDNDGSTSLCYDGRTWGDHYANYFKAAANVNTGATITIDEVDGVGKVQVSGSSKAIIDAAMSKIKAIVAVPEIGEVYEGTVRSVMPYGCFVEFMPGKDGLLHISEIDWKRLETVEEAGIKEGDKLQVKLLEIDPKTGKFKLSRRVLIEKPEGYVERERRPRPERSERPVRGERGERPMRGDRRPRPTGDAAPESAE